MPKLLSVKIKVPDDLAELRLPAGVNARLQTLLDRQSIGKKLNAAERQEAEGLVNLSELLSLLRLRAERGSRRKKPA
jgi:hypothetical protein